MRTDIELQVAADLDAPGSGPDLAEPVGIRVRLCEEQVHIPQHRAKEPAEAPVTGKGSIRDASVDDRDSSAPFTRQVEQVGPEFGLGEQKQAWLEYLQVGPNGKAQVQRHQETLGLAKPVARQTLCGSGSGGDKDLRSRVCLSQFDNKPAYGQHLSHGDGMHPDGARPGVCEAEGHNAEALGKTGAIFTQAQHLQEPPGQRENRRTNQKQAVKDIHEGLVILWKAPGCANPEVRWI